MGLEQSVYFRYFIFHFIVGVLVLYLGSLNGINKLIFGSLMLHHPGSILITLLFLLYF